MYDVNLTESLFPPQTDGLLRDITVGELLRETVDRLPKSTALVDVSLDGTVGREWNYGELLETSEKLAIALTSRFKPGERVVVWAPNIPEWLFMEYACALAGLVLVTANPSFQQKELRYVLEQLIDGSKRFIISTGFFKRHPQAESLYTVNLWRRN